LILDLPPGTGGTQLTLTQSLPLSGAVEVALRQSVPEITRVIDVTDHAASTNPYYERARK